LLKIADEEFKLSRLELPDTAQIRIIQRLDSQPAPVPPEPALSNAIPLPTRAAK
jgi:hypothetical protein